MLFPVVGIILGAVLVFLLPTEWFLHLAIAFAAVFNPSVRLGPFGVYLSTALVVVLCVRVIFSCIRDRRFPVPLSTAVDRVLVVFTAYTLLITLGKGTGASSYKREMSILLFYMGYLTFRQLSGSRAELIRQLKTMAYSAPLASMIGLYTYYFAPFLGSKNMAYGTFGNPNGLATYLFMTIPLLVFFLMKERASFLWWSLPAISVFCMVRTGSRTGLITLIVIAVFWIGRTWPKQLFLILLVSPLFILLAEERWQFVSRYETIFDISTIVNVQRSHLVPTVVTSTTHDFTVLPWTEPGQFDSFPDSLGARYVIWGQALALIPQNLMLGWGPNVIRLSGLPYDSKWFDNCFNQYISITLDFGLIGLFLLFALIKGVWTQINRTIASGGDGATSAVLIGSILIGQLLHGCAEDPIYAILSNWVLAFLIAATSSLYVHSLETRPHESPHGIDERTVR